MRVSEETTKIVYLLSDAEMTALFDYYQHGQFEKDNHPIFCSVCDKTEGLKPKPKDVVCVRYIDVTWPATQKTNRFYRQDHPRNADVLRMSKTLSVSEEPRWLRSHIK